MTVTVLSEREIHGKTYKRNDKFKCADGTATGDQDSEGHGPDKGGTLTQGKEYYFLGYAVPADSSTKIVKPCRIGNGTDLRNDVIGWFPESVIPYATYTITLNNQSATTAGTTSVTATYNSAMPSITVPKKTGYTFGGYYTGTGGSGTQYYTSSGASARKWDKTSNTTLYAKWTANTYTVKYNANGGTGSTSSSTHTYDASQKLNANAFTRTGYSFAGWSKTADSNVVYDDQESVTNLTSTNNGTVNLYAQWTANPYPIILHGQGGKIENGQSVQYNAYFDGPVGGLNYGLSLPVPIRAGYNFIGWNTQDDGKGNYYTGEETMNVVGGLVLYAQWEPAASLVTIQINGQPRRGMMHMYDDNGQLCYAIMTIYDEDGNGYYTC